MSKILKTILDSLSTITLKLTWRALNVTDCMNTN